MTGDALTVAGLLLAGWGIASLGVQRMLLITLNELIVGSVAQYTLMRLTPAEAGPAFIDRHQLDAGRPDRKHDCTFRCLYILRAWVRSPP